MKAVIFIETNDGLVYYKCDTFWSKSLNIKNAKVYYDDQNEIDKWINSYKYNIEQAAKNNMEDYVQNIYPNFNECKCGYITIDSKFIINGGYSISDDVELGQKLYTHQLYLDIEGKNQTFVDIRKQLIREEKLKNLI
jgi:hypothetical protein